MDKKQKSIDFELLPKTEIPNLDVQANVSENKGGQNVLNIEGFGDTDSHQSISGNDDHGDVVVNVDDEDDGVSVLGEQDNWCSKGTKKIQSAISGFLNKYKRQLKIGIYSVLLILYSIYFCYAMYYSFEEAVPLFAMTSFVLLCVVYVAIRNKFGDKVNSAVCQPVTDFCDRHWNVIRWISGIVTLLLGVLWIIIDTSNNPSNLMSFVGVIVILLFCYVYSKHPDKIRWRPVVWGLVLQVILALLILRTSWGFTAFSVIGEQMSLFVDYTEAGSKFVFGDLWYNHYFAFKIMPLTLYFGSVIAILYHYGLVQLVIEKLAWLLQFTMHTTAGESLAAAACIFLSLAEVVILVGPYIATMSVSELHAIATCSYSTIAGSVLGAGIAFGISPSSMITASAMSAPAALAVSKMIYPETKISPSSSEYKSGKIKMPKYQNVIDAVTGGALSVVPIIVNICVNFIVFLALLEFINACLSWAGGLVGYSALSFEIICAWVFMPIAYLMGVDWKDCFLVGELIGMKIVTSVLISFQKLSILLENRELGLEPQLSPRSEVIATYALCGFSHLTGIGLTIGTLLGIAPGRSKAINAVVVRAMIAGNVANFLTACIAGILFQEDMNKAFVMNSTDVNMTLANTTLMTVTDGLNYA